MSMVPGAGFFKGSETATVFEQLLLVLSWSKNQKLKICITGVPFGRTELSLRLSVSIFGALSRGHGPKACFLQGKRKSYGFRTNAVSLVLIKTLKTRSFTWAGPKSITRPDRTEKTNNWTGLETTTGQTPTTGPDRKFAPGAF